MRKLVTVRRVSTLDPIPGADLIEVATVDGWQCVVKKGEFQVGSSGLYFEIDSFLPLADERFGFLMNKAIKWEGKEGARIKTIRLRKQLSQGLLLPLAQFPEVEEKLASLWRNYESEDSYEQQRFFYEKDLADLDFSELLGVEKWEKPLPACLAGRAKGNFPSFIPKTDQERVQNVRGLESWLDEEFQCTTKMDGSSMTVYVLHPGTQAYDVVAPEDHEGPFFGVCSRNLDLVEHGENQFWKTVREEYLLDAIVGLGRNIAIQGELCGSGIQGNFEGFPEGVYGFYLYDIWDIENQVYFNPRTVESLANIWGMKHVPIVSYAKLREFGETKAALLDLAEGKGINGKPREGIVFKHEHSGFSFKAISNSYLLTHGE